MHLSEDQGIGGAACCSNEDKSSIKSAASINIWVILALFRHRNDLEKSMHALLAQLCSGKQSAAVAHRTLLIRDESR